MIDLTEVLYVDSNVLIAECPEEMEMTDETFAKVNERFEELASQPAVDTHISNLQMEAHCDTCSRVHGARRLARSRITDWVIVSEGSENGARVRSARFRVLHFAGRYQSRSDGHRSELAGPSALSDSEDSPSRDWPLWASVNSAAVVSAASNVSFWLGSYSVAAG